jgi:hypothetical protein
MAKLKPGFLDVSAYWSSPLARKGNGYRDTERHQASTTVSEAHNHIRARAEDDVSLSSRCSSSSGWKLVSRRPALVIGILLMRSSACSLACSSLCSGYSMAPTPPYERRLVARGGPRSRQLAELLRLLTPSHLAQLGHLYIPKKSSITLGLVAHRLCWRCWQVEGLRLRNLRPWWTWWTSR